jgi:hypothetical protein
MRGYLKSIGRYEHAVSNGKDRKDTKRSSNRRQNDLWIVLYLIEFLHFYHAAWVWRKSEDLFLLCRFVA